MFTVEPLGYFDGNKNHRKKRKFHIRYDRMHAYPNYGPNYDLRLIILRHAERVDGILGDNWYDQVFGGVPSAPAQMYRHPILPKRLPQRTNTLLYVFDPPITRSGQQNSLYKGRELASQRLTVDACYSSPACRSVLTASAVLQGLHRNDVPIRIEPSLFEPMGWNTPLQSLGDISPFMSKGEWMRSGYNIDRNYRRLNNYLNPVEDEYEFYGRSQAFLESLERRHDGMIPFIDRRRRRPSTILIVGHAASPLIYPTIALQQPFDAEAFGKNCGNVSYLHTTILERDATNRTWSIRFNTPFV